MNRDYPIQVYINFTKRCNLKCKHCYSNSGFLDKRNINVKKLSKLINKIKPLRVIISGGEPFILAESINNFIKTLDKKPFVTIITNGTIFNEKVKRLIQEVGEVVVSLDTLKKDSFLKIRGKDQLSIVLKNIKKIKKIAKKTSINYTIFCDNKEEIEKIIEYMKRNNLKYLNILKQRRLGRSKEILKEEEILEVYKKAIKLSKKYRIVLRIHDPGVNKLNLRDYKTECYAGDKIVSIDTEFNFKACPFINEKFKGDFDRIWNTRKLSKCIGKYSCVNKLTRHC